MRQSDNAAEKQVVEFQENFCILSNKLGFDPLITKDPLITQLD